MPFGLPSPVQASQPAPARYAPLSPSLTSRSTPEAEILVQDRIEEPERRSEQLVETGDQARPHRRRGARSADAADRTVGRDHQHARVGVGDSRNIRHAAADTMSGVDRHRNVGGILVGRQRKHIADAAAGRARRTVVPHCLAVDHAIGGDDPCAAASQDPRARGRKIDVLPMVLHVLGRALVAGGTQTLISASAARCRASFTFMIACWVQRIWPVGPSSGLP